MPNRYNCIYVLFLFLRSNCCKKLTLSLFTHKPPKQTIVSIDNHRPFPLQFKPLEVNSKLNWRIFIFFSALGTNGLNFQVLNLSTGQWTVAEHTMLVDNLIMFVKMKFQV